MLQELRCRKMSATAQINIFGNVGNNVYHLFLFVKLQSFLREIAKTNGFADVETSAIGLHLAKQHLDERRFSRTIVAHDTHLLETCEVIVKVVKDNFLGRPRFGNILAFEYFRANINIAAFKAHLPFFNALLGLGLQFVKRVFAILCLMAARLWLSAHPI